MVTVEEIFTLLKNQNLVSTQVNFSRISGRKRSWASASIARQMDMPLDALTAIYCHLLTERNTSTDDVAIRLENTLADVWKQICYNVQIRDHELVIGSR